MVLAILKWNLQQGGLLEVQSESQGESAAGDGYAIKCCNNKGKQEQQKTVDPTT